MAQRPRLSSLVCAGAEATEDSVTDSVVWWKEVLRQGRITRSEADEMTLRLQRSADLARATVSLAADADEGNAIGLVIQKCGPDSPQARRLMAERRQRQARPLALGNGRTR